MLGLKVHKAITSFLEKSQKVSGRGLIEEKKTQMY